MLSPVALTMAALVAAGAVAATGRPPNNPPLPPGWRRMKQNEVTPEHTAFAVEARRHIGPIGKLQYADISGRATAALTEWHYHDPSGPVRPHGWHKGISLLVESTT